MKTEELNKYVNALLNKSEEAYLMAIEIINKPTINYRTEGFCFFICNAWELLLKAYLINKAKDINIINYKDVSSLILNPTNLLMFEKIKKELDSDETLGQTLRLVSTKKEAEADIKYTVVSEGGEKATIINVPKDIDRTHPYNTTEVIKKIKETLELSLGPEHKFTSNKFQDICKRKGIKNNQDYCYQFSYSTNKIYRYSYITIEYVSQVYIEEFKNTKKCE